MGFYDNSSATDGSSPSGAVSPFHSQRNTFVTRFPSQKTFFYRWLSQTCLFRTQVHFLRRGAHFSPLTVLHFIKTPRQIFVDATHGPGRHSQRTRHLQDLWLPHHLPAYLPSASLSGGWKRVWGADLGESNSWAGCRCAGAAGRSLWARSPSCKAMPRDAHSSRTTHMSLRSISTQHLSMDPTSIPPPSTSREGDSPECSAFPSLLEFQSGIT